MSKEELRQELISFYQRTIDYDDPDREYIGYMADKSIELAELHLATRVKLPITMQEIANYCGVSRQTIHAWIKNPGSIKLDHLAKLMKLEEKFDDK